MSELTNDQKREIVTMLAHYKRPAEIAVLMRELHNVECSLPQIVKYDPTRANFVAGDWARDLFEAQRKAFNEGLVAIPIANQNYRLGVLQTNLDKAMNSGNRILANQTLKQAAEEIGGSYTNVSNVNVSKHETTPEDRRKEFADVIDTMLSRKSSTAPSTSVTQ